MRRSKLLIYKHMIKCDIIFQKILQLRNEHEVQMKALRTQYEDVCKKLQDELDIQKSKVLR